MLEHAGHLSLYCETLRGVPCDFFAEEASLTTGAAAAALAWAAVAVAAEALIALARSSRRWKSVRVRSGSAPPSRSECRPAFRDPDDPE